MRVVEQVEIDAEPAEVWRVVSDPGTHTAWRPALAAFSAVDETPLVVGSRIREVIRWRGREIEIDDVVTALEPERLLGLTGTWPAAEFDVALRLERTGRGTRVTFDWTLRPQSLLLKLTAPFLGGAMRRATEEELRHLQRYVEERRSNR
jgi:uncharacterized protein YndB with AHSA1/START domain